MIGVYGQKDLNISIMACWGADQAKYFPRLRQDKVKYYFDKIMRLKEILNTGTPCYLLYYPKPKIWWSEILNLIKRGPSENARLLNMIRCYAALFSLQPSLTASTRPGLAWYSGFCKWVTSYLSSDGGMDGAQAYLPIFLNIYGAGGFI